jgi:hypothetical protein
MIKNFQEWRPTQRSSSKLRRIGLSKKVIEAASNKYLTSCIAKQIEPCDRQFEFFVLNNIRPVSLDSCDYVALDWKPSKEVVSKLISLGYSRELIGLAEDCYIIGVRERKQIPVDINTNFFSYVLNAYSFKARSKQGHWYPSVATFTEAGIRGFTPLAIEDLRRMFVQTMNGELTEMEANSLFLSYLQKCDVAHK